MNFFLLSFSKRQETKSTSSDASLGKSRTIVQNFCTADQMRIEKEAWDDAGILANHLDTWQPLGKGQAAVDLYFGTDSAKSYPYGLLWEQLAGWSNLLGSRQV